MPPLLWLPKFPPKEAVQSISMLLECIGARLHEALEVLLVPERAAGDLRVGDGDHDAAANVAHEIDESGNLVAFFLGHADVGGVGDGDEAEGQGKHLNDAQPGGLGEAHLQIGDVGGVAEGDDEHDESADGERSRGDLAGGDAGHWHDDDAARCRRR